MDPPPRIILRVRFLFRRQPVPRHVLMTLFGARRATFETFLNISAHDSLLFRMLPPGAGKRLSDRGTLAEAVFSGKVQRVFVVAAFHGALLRSGG